MMRAGTKKILLSLVIFAVSFALFLFLWIQIKETYGNVMVSSGSRVVSFLKDVRFKEIMREHEKITAVYHVPVRRGTYRIRLDYDTNAYTFNVPLTLAIMSALSLFIGRRARAWAEGLAVLVLIHLFCVIAVGTGMLSQGLVNIKVETNTFMNSVVWHFLWQFTEHMVLKFEPFLIGIYMVLRFPSSEGASLLSGIPWVGKAGSLS